ncbi:immunoglobulin-like fold-containing [Desulfonema limicola]|uniref:Immunoglobulin-like fold-containing n=1 Tax=Desulfonema limicola TaxID=45656 RepID=A0A975BC41_9BACT|nr:Ig-like domain-containing protein [Desulfonema limicola]QTA82628.1 immunoglobulin-like fold-containing [Desulfonema limicola]
MKSIRMIRSGSLLLFTAFVFLFLTLSSAYAALSISPIEDKTGNEDSVVKVNFSLSGDLDGISVEVSSDNTQLIPDKNIIHTGSGASHILTIVPEPDKYGQADIKIMVESDSGSDSETFRLEIKAVDDKPVVTIPDTQSLNENSELVFNNENGNIVTVDDIDAGDNEVKLTISAEHGTLKIEGSTQASITGNNTKKLIIKGSLNKINNDINGLIYKPELKWNGEEILTFTIDDQGHTGMLPNPFSDSLTDTKKLTVSVISVNDAPVITIPGSQKTDEDIPLIFNEENKNQILVDDPDSGDGEIEILLNLDNGVLIISSDVEAVIDGSSSDEMTIRGTLTQVNEALNGLECRFENNWNGDAQLTITADDLGNTGEGGPLTDTKTLDIIVEPVNDPPVISHSGSTSIDEDTSLTIAVTVQDPDAGDGDINLYFSVDKGSLEIPETQNVEITEEGLEEYNLKGSAANVNLAMKEIIYTPFPNWNGTAVIAIKANDNGNTGGDPEESQEAEIEISIAPVNDAPVINNSSEIALDPIEINEQNSPGESVRNIIKNLIEDKDITEIPAGIAVVAADNENGLWMYSIDNIDQTWLNFPENLSETTAVLLDSNALIRFVPNKDWEGKAVISFRAWDLTGENENGDSDVDTSINGGSTPFSEEILTAFIIAGDPDFIFPNAGPDQNVLEGQEVTLDSSASSYPSDTNITFLWEQTEGIEVILSDAGIEKPVFTAPMTEGSTLKLTFKLTLANDENETFSDTVNINVKPAALLIKAIAGEDQEVIEGDIVTLDASESEIPEGTEVMITWSQTEGTAVTLSDINKKKPEFTAPGVGAEGEKLTFQLTITDIENNEYTDTTIITVKDSESIEANAGDDMEAMEGEEVMLDGSRSKIPGDSALPITWTQTEGTIVTLSADNIINPSFTAPELDADEDLIFKLTLTDSEGQEYTDTVTVKIKDGDAIVADAGINQTVIQGETVTLDASASIVPDDVSPLYEWKQKDGKAVELSNPASVQTTFIAPDLEDGQEMNLVFEVTVSNNAERSDSAEVVITIVEQAVSEPPVADAGADQNVNSGASVTLDASASSDPDGEIKEYKWEEISSFEISLSGADTKTAVFTAPSGGETGKTLEFKLTITDNDGNKAEDTIKINVAKESVIPGPGQSETFKEGQTVTLNVSDTGDIGTVVSYNWEQISGPAVELSDPHSPNPVFIAPIVGTQGAEIAFKVTLTGENGTSSNDTITIGIKDNGITGFPDDVLTFTPTTTSVMGIKTNGKLVKLEPFDPAKITDQKNRPSSLIYGMIDMNIKVDNPGDKVPVTIYFKNAAPSGYKWYKYSYTDGWQDFSGNTVFNSDRTQITITLTDGGPGDDDKTANGIIKDPSGLGKISDTETPDPDAGGGDGDSDGGCFIKSVNSSLFSFFK